MLTSNNSTASPNEKPFQVEPGIAGVQGYQVQELRDELRKFIAKTHDHLMTLTSEINRQNIKEDCKVSPIDSTGESVLEKNQTIEPQTHDTAFRKTSIQKENQKDPITFSDVENQQAAEVDSPMGRLNAIKDRLAKQIAEAS